MITMFVIGINEFDLFASCFIVLTVGQHSDTMFILL